LPLSRQLGSLAVIPPRAGPRDLRPFTGGFPDAHAFARLPGSPNGYELPFGSPKRAARSLQVSSHGVGSFRQLHLLRSFDPSCESVHGRLGLPLTDRPILSWASAPLELSPPGLGVSDPLEPRLAHGPRVRGLAARDAGDRGPSRRVRLLLHRD